MKTIKITGVGLHSGTKSELVINATKKGGIVFIRNDKKVPAVYSNVSETHLRSTTIGTKESKVQTIEHIMAALFVCGIKNAEIYVSDRETPILDGSALEFIKKLKNLDGANFDFPRLRVKKEIIVKQSKVLSQMPFLFRIMMMALNFIKRKKLDGFIKLSPINKNQLEIKARINHPNEPIIGDEEYSFIFDYNNFSKSAKSFITDIARSRTFGTVSEWEWLKKHGMAHGVNEDNLIALGTMDELKKLQSIGVGLGIKKDKIVFVDKIHNGALTGLFYKDEFVRHKIIDIVGDLYTSGFAIVGKVEMFKSGHSMHNLLLKELFKNKDNYEIL